MERYSLSFKQYIPSKKSRFGVKFFILCDCDTKFILNFIIYTFSFYIIRKITRRENKSLWNREKRQRWNTIVGELANGQQTYRTTGGLFST